MDNGISTLQLAVLMLTSIGGRPSVAVLRSAALWTLTVNNDPWISAADMRTRKKQKLATEPHEPCTTSWTLDCPSNYFLRASVISYGFFMLSPNCLTPVRAILHSCSQDDSSAHIQSAQHSVLCRLRPTASLVPSSATSKQLRSKLYF